MKFSIVSTARSMIVLVVYLGCTMNGWGQVIHENIKLLANDGSERDWLGASTAMSDGLLVAGAVNDDELGTGAGSVYIFDAHTGEQLYKFVADDGSEGDRFGHTVAIDQGVLVVGAPEDDSGGFLSGSVYIYDLNTGLQVFKIIPSDIEPEDRFGWSVAIENDVVAVGSKFDDDLGQNSGSVYLYDAQSGHLIRKITPGDGSGSDFFGWAVDLENGILAASSLFDDDTAIDSGSVYLFNPLSGKQLGKIIPTLGELRMEFGMSISMNAGRLAVGATGYGSDFGTAYLFDISTGDQLFMLHPNDPSEARLFGISVALEHDKLVVGSNFGHGKAYVFEVSTGLQLVKLFPESVPWWTEFGGALAIENGMVLVGASADSETATQAGAAYVFNLSETDCRVDLNQDSQLDFFDISQFLTAYSDEQMSVDFNSDGKLDFFDVSMFLNLFAAGCP